MLSTTRHRGPVARAQSRGDWRVRWMLAGMAFTLLAAAGMSAWAQQPPAPPDGRPGWGDRMRGGMRGEMHGRGPGGHGGGMERGMFGGSPERMNRAIDRMLDGLAATDAQRTQIKQIAATAAADLKAQRQSGRDLRSRGMQALLAPNVDTAGVEAVRQQMLQQHDQSSRRMSQALIDIARVLTPEQRARASARLQDMQARMQDRQRRMEQQAPTRPGAPR